MTSHLDDGTIHELLDGEIPSSQLAPIQDHLASCAECRARLEAARVFVAETDELIEALDVPAPAHNVVKMVPTPATSRAWIRQAAWAASLVIAVGAGYFARGAPIGIGEFADADTADTTPAAVRQAAPSGSIDTAIAAPTTPRIDQRRNPSAASPAAEDRTTGARRDEPAGGVAAAPPVVGAAPLELRDARTPAELSAREQAPATVPPPAPTAAGSAALERRRASDGRQVDIVGQLAPQAQNALVPRDQVTTKQVFNAGGADTISFTDAVRRLGGRLLLIEGMVPVRLEAAGNAVRVIYPVSGGELVLRQSFVNGVPVISLTAPSGFPADSLAVLRRKVQE